MMSNVDRQLFWWRQAATIRTGAKAESEVVSMDGGSRLRITSLNSHSVGICSGTKYGQVSRRVLEKLRWGIRVTLLIPCRLESLEAKKAIG